MCAFMGTGPPWRELTPNELDEMIRTLLDQSLVGAYIIQDGVFAYFNRTKPSATWAPKT